ncbi:MAG: SGNH/GDSL hydrolase family protein [Rhizobiaceae bacterium]
MKTLICFGDSNTHGTLPMRSIDDKRRFAFYERWPGVVAEFLGDGWSIIEEGLPGRTTVHDDPIEGRHKNGMSALPMVLETHRPIDALVIMLGTNDLKARFSVGPWDIADAAGRLVEAAISIPCWADENNPSILLVCPAPIIETGSLTQMFAGGEAKSKLFGEFFASAVDRFPCEYLDAGTVFKSSPVDGIHLDESAHKSLGLAIGQKIKSMHDE